MTVKKKQQEHTNTIQELDKKLSQQRVEEVQAVMARLAQLQTTKEKDDLVLKEQKLTIEAHEREIARLMEVEKSLEAEMKLTEEAQQKITELEEALTAVEAKATSEESKRASLEREQENANIRNTEQTAEIKELKHVVAASKERAETVQLYPHLDLAFDVDADPDATVRISK